MSALARVQPILQAMQDAQTLVKLLDDWGFIRDTLQSLGPNSQGERKDLEEALAKIVKGIEFLLKPAGGHEPLKIDEADVAGLWDICLHFESQASIAKREATECTQRQKRAETMLERLESSIQASMELYQQKRLEGFTSTVPVLELATRPASVAILDEKLIPKEYLREIPSTTEPDKVAIKAVLKKGGKVAGCELSEGNLRLVRK